VQPAEPRLPRKVSIKQQILDNEAAAKHLRLCELAKANDPNRDWIPMREVKTVFRKRYTNPRSGNTHNAADYGYRAFPIEQKGSPLNLKALSLQRKKRVAKQCDPIESGYRLVGAFAAGDRIRHATFGTGMILSISPINTVFRFDATGLQVMDTITVHQYLTKVAEPIAESTS
jgi:hypothetical protein